MDRGRIKVVHIVTGLSVGGAETVLLKLAEGLRLDFEQHVISLTNYGPIGEKVAALGIGVDALKIGRNIPNPFGILKLIERIRQLSPFVVQTWMYHADLIGGFAARAVGVPAVAWNIRNNDLSSSRVTRRTRYVAALCAKLSRWIPERIITCSKAAVETHVSGGYARDRFVVIPNGFDASRFAPDEAARRRVRVELRVPDLAPLIGLIARFDPQKNHSIFFSAATRLHVRRPDVHFLLAGQGVERTNSQIVRWVKDAGIDHVVRLLGERSDVPRLTAALDIASSSSSSEAFPNVLAEAMACGVPCVATDVGDASFIVANTGRIVPANDAEALASAWEDVLSLSATERQVLGAQARARVVEHFEIGIMIRRYADLYREMTVSKR